MTRILVYGTLMRGESNFRRFMSMRAIYKGHAQTLHKSFAMVAYSAGNGETMHDHVYPGAHLAHHVGLPGGRISGEVYEIGAEQLGRLDELEAVGIVYDRVKVKLNDGTHAFMYLKRADERLGKLRSPFIRWRDGAWAWSQKRGVGLRKMQQAAAPKRRDKPFLVHRRPHP